MCRDYETCYDQGITSDGDKQIIAHVTTLLRFGPQHDDPTVQLIQANLEAFHVESGLSSQLFGLPIKIKPYLTQSWITHTWEHCRNWDIDIMMDVKDFEQPWHNDKELMKMFLQHGVSGQDLASLNQCCM